MGEENSRKLEESIEKVNNSRNKAAGLKDYVERFSEELEQDLEGPELGEYFAVEDGYSELALLKESVDEFGEEIKESFGLAAYAEPEKVEKMLEKSGVADSAETTAEKLSEIGELYDESADLLQETAKTYMNELESGETDIYGSQDVDDLLPSGGKMYKNGKEIYVPDKRNLPPLQKLSIVGEKLEKEDVESYRETAKVAADD